MGHTTPRQVGFNPGNLVLKTILNINPEWRFRFPTFPFPPMRYATLIMLPTHSVPQFYLFFFFLQNEGKTSISKQGLVLCVCVVCTQSLTRISLFATPWIVAHHSPCPWNFLGKNTGVGCHFLLQAIFLI